MFKTVKNVVLIMAPTFLLLAWVGYILWQASSGMPVKVRLRGYDPRDLLSGQYISYTLDWDNTDCAQFAGNKCPRDEFVKYGMNWGRFYVTEDLAQALEQDIRNSDNAAEMVFSYQPGKQPYILNLLVNGRNWDGSNQGF